jgi:hypothetical protein
VVEDRRDLYNGFGNGLSRAVELALTPALFGGLGWLLDRWLGLFPVLTLLIGFLGVVGTFVSTWYRYEADMKAEEARAPWAPRS